MQSVGFAIVEIGSNNTKTHVYRNGETIYESNVTITFKKHYAEYGSIDAEDLRKLHDVIEKALEYTNKVYLYGCSIFRQLSLTELDEVNADLREKFGVEIEVVPQADEAKLTALGCYGDLKYDGRICVFVGGGGSIELIVVENGKIIDSKYYDFGVVDITKKFPSLSDDVPEVELAEVLRYIDELLGDLGVQADVLVLAGGDHLYWYKNAQYELLQNSLYESARQPYMLNIAMSDEYDQDVYKTSLDEIRQRSDDPAWFDCARAMKAVTNCLAHKIGAKFIVPTNINMEDGLRKRILDNEK